MSQFQDSLFPRERTSFFRTVPSVERAMGNPDMSSARPMSTQDRYALYQSYNRDKARVDAGGAPRKRTVASYNALRPHIGQQFQQITSDPTLPDVNFGEYDNGQPGGYTDAGKMTASMRRGQLNVNATRPGEETIAWDNDTNDQFRAVHDMIGHGVSGGSFSPAGESLATQAHKATMPRETHDALTAEVIGQATHYEFTGGQFVDQKGLYSAPRWAVEGRSAPTPPRKTHISRAKQGKLFT